MRKFVSLREFSLVCVAGLVLPACSSAPVQTPTLTGGAGYKQVYNESETRHSLRSDFYLHPIPTDVGDIIIAAQNRNIKEPWKKKWFRNYVQYDLMRKSDQICTAYMTRLIHAFVAGGAAATAGQNIAKALISLASLPTAAVAVLGDTTGGIANSLSTEVLQHEKFTKVTKQIVETREGQREPDPQTAR